MINNQDGMHPEDRRNLIIFGVMAVLVWLSFDHFLLKPRLEEMRKAREAVVAAQQVAATDPAAAAHAVIRPRADVLTDSPRLRFENESIAGSIALRGGRVDDLKLKRYFKTLEKKDNVVLLSPAQTDYPRYAETGWLAADGKTTVPDSKTLWQTEGSGTLTPDTPVTIFWDNGQGLRFEKTYTIDKAYMIGVVQRVINNGTRAISVHPYALISQQGMTEDFAGGGIAHEGPLSWLDGNLTEMPFRKMTKEPLQEISAVTGWIGLSDKYWFTSLIPDQTTPKTFRFVYTPPAVAKAKERYQADYIAEAVNIAPGARVETAINLFSGAKEVNVLDRYEREKNIPHFDLAVDFGLYYFLTKPFFYTLDLFGRLTGNMGIALLCLTIVVRLAVFPLANTSYKSFAGLKKIAPQMKEIRERCGDDREKLQQELVALYEKEKVNPMAGCMPILIQIPIFFALYKILSVTIEVRHAPFFGWIEDLSARDPITVFNGFGLINWDPPSVLMIGPWSLAMLAAMMIQKHMNPPPQDKMQATINNIMPYFITYILSKYAVGLVIYWTFSNFLSIAQQYIIMKRLGVEIHLFSRNKDEKKMEELVAAGPTVHPAIEVVEEKVEDALFGDEGKTISPPKPKKKKKR